jgi:hypothetical protein
VENGIPLAVDMDRHGIFRRNDDHWTLEEQLAGQQTPTQVTQALLALGIEPVFALSPQAKGRVERLFNALQDRLVQELRLAGIKDPQQATVFLNGPFKTDFNSRFAKLARESQKAWRPLPKELDVDRICSFRYEATVGNDNAVRLCGMILDIPPGPRRRGYARAGSSSANSSMAAGVCTTKTSFSGRRLLLRSTSRSNSAARISLGKNPKNPRVQEPIQKTAAVLRL